METLDKPGATAAQPASFAGIDIALDRTALNQHVMRPAHVLGVRSDRGIEDEPALPAGPLTQGPAKHLNLKAFTDNLHAALKNDVIGYAMRLRQNGSTVETLEWNWAQTPSDGSVGWTPGRQMHVASVSKLITAIAMTKALDDHGISYDAKIVDHLPAYWHKGPNVQNISFRNLMTQTSGFATAHGETDYETMLHAVAFGVFTGPPAANYVGHYRYENMNFGLCRILIAIINGNVNKNLIWPDAFWDFATISSYAAYVKAHVLTPSGAAGATLAHPAGAALAYRFPANGNGWNSGDLSAVCGGAGWHLSIDELLNVMGTFRRKGTIMSPAKAQGLLDNGFGIDVIQGTAAGTLYNKNGLWEDASDASARVEQALAYFLPENMELAVFVNSPVGNPAKFFRNVVTQIYLDHLV
jgi:CubicO group peptidase (beta-lactamase class C family)